MALADQPPGRVYPRRAAERHLDVFTAADGWVDLEPYYAHRASLQPNSNLLDGVPTVTGYVGIAPALLYSFRALLAYGVWIGALCLAGLACFHFWPTAIPANLVDTAQYPGFALIQGLDAPGNACPSLHVATAVFSAVWLDRLLRELDAAWPMRAINWGWFALIAWSTMAVKQHVALDVLAGSLLGLAFALPSLRLRPASL